MPELMAPEAPPPEGTQPARERRSKLWWVGVAAAVLVVGAVALGVDVRGGLRQGLNAVERLGPWGPVLFIVIYAVATVFLVPGSLLTLGAGAVFGVVWGSVYVSLASTLGATAAFLVGRHAARDWVARRIAGNLRFQAIDRAVGEEGWKIVGLTRLSPVFPFTLLNYAFGLTRVSLKGYVLASWVGMMPGTVMYVYLGSIAGAGAVGPQRTPAQWALSVVGLAATIAVTVIITRIARRALSRHTEDVKS